MKRVLAALIVPLLIMGGGLSYKIKENNFAIEADFVNNSKNIIKDLQLYGKNRLVPLCEESYLAPNEEIRCFSLKEKRFYIRGKSCDFLKEPLNLDNGDFQKGDLKGWNRWQNVQIINDKNNLLAKIYKDEDIGYLYRDIKVDDKGIYIISFDAKAAFENINPASALLTPINEEGMAVGKWKEVKIIRSGFKNYTLSIKLPENAVAIRILFSNNFSNYLLVDNIKLFKVVDIDEDSCERVEEEINSNIEPLSSSFKSRNTQKASLGDRVWYDENINGIQDLNESNLGIEGVKVHLYKDGKDTGIMTTTKKGGIYLFENLEPNHYYSIKVDLPKNYKGFTLQNRGDDESKDRDVNGFGESDKVYLKAGENYRDLDVGLVCKCVAWINIKKYTNNQDANTPPGAIVKVGDKVIWKYIVSNTSAAKVCEIEVYDDQEGEISCPKDCLEANESMSCFKEGVAKEGLYKNMARVIATGPGGQKITDNDPSHYFGEIAKIDLEKYTNNEDADNPPGVLVGAGEKVIWKYVVKNIGNVKLYNVEVKDDKEGIICSGFNLDINESKVCTKEGIAQDKSYENKAIATAISEYKTKVSDSDLSHYYILSGSSIGDYYWYDENVNGIQDPDEPGVVGMEVSLYNEQGVLLRKIKTDKKGRYLFDHLEPGKYRIKCKLPDTYLFTIKDKGDDNKDSDVNKEGWSDWIVLGENDHQRKWDCGIFCSCDEYKLEGKDDSDSSPSLNHLFVLLLIIFTMVIALLARGVKE
ncbi:MAG: hypothetical protein GXO02_06220 [Epsilonproteobacteria bacterium]|nr:hypothetical protein [Campylobacterota bacterium]